MSFDARGGPSTPPARGFSGIERSSDILRNRASSSAQPMEFGMQRASSMRSISNQSPYPSFGGGAGREATTPKSVRWGDAPTTPGIQAPQWATPPAHPSTSLSQYPFSLQATEQQSQSQSQSQQVSTTQVSGQLGFSQYTLTRQQTPHRFEEAHPTPPAPSERAKALIPSPATSAVQQQTRSAFNRTGALVPNTMPSLPLSKTSHPANRPPNLPSTSTLSRGSQNDGIASRPATVSRLKWNVGALILFWFGPRLDAVGRMYWITLDLAYKSFGGDADVHLSTIYSWLYKATLLILLINVVEAVIVLNTSHVSGASNEVTKRKPSLAHPSYRAVSASSPAAEQGTSSTPSTDKRSTPRQYAQDSPLRESIFRASINAQGLGEGLRLPSQGPKLESASRSSASPLAAFLARKQDRVASGGDAADLSWDGDAADLSTDSIEVDRALRAFSAGYERELSQSRSLVGEGEKSVIVV